MKNLDRSLLSQKLLFMVRLEPVIAGSVSLLAKQLKRGYGLGGSLIAAERLHITLQYIDDYGDLPPDDVRRARAAADRVKAAPIDVRFDRALTFVGSGAIVLVGDESLAPLIALQRSLTAALKHVNLGKLGNVTPHVTILRSHGYIEEQMVRSFEWTIRHFSLVNSLAGRSRYVEIDRWRLN